MKLFSKEIDKKLFKQYPKGADLSSQVAVAKIFNPYGKGRWYLINSDPEDPNYLWAIVQIGDIVEVGSVSRNELESLRIPPFRLPLERDLGFGGVNAAELFKGLRAGKFYKAGGWTEGSENKEMLLNQAEGFEHHAEEFESAVKKADYVPAWVVAKSQRASTDLSDITHYLDGENEQREEEVQGEEEYGNGGIIGGLTADELIYLYVKKAIVQKYREKYLKPAGLLGTPKSKYVEQSLIKKGFLNNAGAITELGKNKAREVDSEIGLMISRGYISSTNLPSKYKEIVEKFESDDKMADGGEVKWQDAHYGDNALVVSENKMGIIIKPYGRKFHLKFADGTEKTYDASELQFFKDMDDFDMGGEVEGVDLFEDYENIPEKVQQVLDNFADAFEDGDYKGLEKANKALQKIGYTFEYGLDGQAYDLRKVGEKGKSESYARGGKLDVGIYYKTKDGRQARYLGDTNDPEVGTFMNKADGVFKLRYDEIEGKASAFAEGGMMAKDMQNVGNNYIEIENPFDDNRKTYTLLSDVSVESNNKIGKDELLIKSNNLEEVVKKSDWEDLLKSKSIDNFPSIGLYKYITLTDKEKQEWHWRAVKNHFSFSRSKNWRIIQGNILEDPLGLGYRKMADGGITDPMATVNEIARLSGLRPVAVAEWGDKNNINLSILLKDLKSKKIKGMDLMTAIVGNANNKYQKELLSKYSRTKMAMGGKVKFADKVKSIKASLLERKKVSPKVQKDYGKTYSPKEAEESAKRIVGAMTAKERLMAKRKKGKK